jgi:hypothetical protein
MCAPAEYTRLVIRAVRDRITLVCVKAHEWKRVVTAVLPASDGWGQAGKLAYRAPARWMVCGVLGESSGWSKATYVWRLTSPLYVPSDHLDLSYSERVGGESRSFEDSDLDGLVAAVREAANATPSEDEALHRLAAMSLDTGNIRVYETAAYAQLLLGDAGAARGVLAAARRLDRATDEPSWIGVVLARMAEIETLLADGQIAGATALLDGWAEETSRALRVERTRA